MIILQIMLKDPLSAQRCQRVMPVSPGSLLMSREASALPHPRAALLHPRGLLAPPRSPLCSAAPAQPVLLQP